MATAEYLRHYRAGTLDQYWRARGGRPQGGRVAVLTPAQIAERKAASDRDRFSNDVVGYLWHCVKSSGKARGLKVTITREDVAALVRPMRCAVTGLPLSWTGPTRKGQPRNPWAPSIDRIDCRRGYEPGNVRCVCLLFNSARSDWQDADVLKMARAFAAIAARPREAMSGVDPSPTSGNYIQGT